MVIDASAAISWFLPSQSTPYASALLETGDVTSFVAPWIFGVELRAVLLRFEGRPGLSRLEIDARIARGLQIVRLAASPSSEQLDAIVQLSRDARIRYYDAHYLDLALSQAAPLASRDGPLLDAARRLGVDVVDLRG